MGSMVLLCNWPLRDNKVVFGIEERVVSIMEAELKTQIHSLRIQNREISTLYAVL